MKKLLFIAILFFSVGANSAFITEKNNGYGVVSDLRILNNATNSTYQLDIDADGVVVRDTINNLIQIYDLNLTVDITASGANGLDTGTEASTTWYYAWVIYNKSTNTTASLLSLSPTAPTMPSGYTYKMMIGAVKNDSSGNFIPFSQVNEEVWYNARQEITGLGSSIYTTQDIRSIVPSASGKVKAALFGSYCTGTCSSTYLFLSTDGTNAKSVFEFWETDINVGEANELYYIENASPIFIPITGNNIYYKNESNTGADVVLLIRAFKWSHIK